MSDNSISSVCLELMATDQLAYYYLKPMRLMTMVYHMIRWALWYTLKTKWMNGKTNNTRNIDINYTCLPTISSVSWLRLPKSVGICFSNLLLSICLTISNDVESQTNLNETIQCTQSYLHRLSFSSRYSSPVLGGIVPENKFSSVIHK